ncbi:MAG: ABC transporter ATP-binding protein [Spirochaetae bacterium HGW-Spirochaetae-5]|nr:MAG: ABC transporter ATP-binding protein [Spirochaetae bacterium HGW-Spirochaetae-5]
MITEKSHSGPVAIRFNHVSFAYGSSPVLEDVNFHIHQGDFSALVGPNGSGKTTILKLLLNLERPDSGRITLFEGLAGFKRDRIGYVPQHAGYDPAFPITVKEVVRMGRLKSFSRKFRSVDEEAVTEAMERAGISELSGQPYQSLSGGQRRRVLVARALASRPLLLILDEPTANMDAESEERLFGTLGSLKGSTTILIVTHDQSFVSSLTDIVLCVGDRLKTGTARTVVRHRTEPAADAPPDLFGGKAVRVRHDVALNDTFCCREVKKI